MPSLRTLLFAATLAAALSSSAAVPLTLTFDAESVRVEGVEPRGTVYLYSLAREPKGYFTSIVAREIKLTDDDGNGKVEWDFETSLPWRSIWFVVDLSSGQHVVASPPQYRQAKRIELTSDHLKRDGAGEITQFGFRGSIVECIVVRPKTNEIWGATVVSGGPDDEDGSADKVRLSTLKLTPRAGTTDAAPKSLKKGDIVFMATSFKALYASAEVDK